MPADTSHGLRRSSDSTWSPSRPPASEIEKSGSSASCAASSLRNAASTSRSGREEIGPALEQRRRYAGAGERRQGRVDRRHLDLGGGIAPEQHFQRAARFAVRLARTLDVAPRRFELGAHVDHVEVGVLAGVAPELHELEQVAVDLHRLLAQREELARLDGDIPELRRRRRQRLARVRVVERGGFCVGLRGRALRAQPSPDVELPRHAEEGGRAAEAAAVLVVGDVGARAARRPTAAAATRPRPPSAARWRPSLPPRAGRDCWRSPRRRSLRAPDR